VALDILGTVDNMVDRREAAQEAAESAIAV
jgi:hypothetical protein